MRSYLVVLVLLAGCQSAPQKQVVWEKPGASQADFNADQGQCRAQGQGSPFGPMSMQAALVFMSCMQGKGWNRVER